MNVGDGKVPIEPRNVESIRKVRRSKPATKWANMGTIQWINYYGIPESYLNPGFKMYQYGFMTLLSFFYAYSGIASLTATLDLFSGAYSGLGLPFGFIGEMIWAFYNAIVLPH